MSRKSSRKHARRRARESALALLYSGDILESNAVAIVEEGAYPDPDVHLSDYAESLVEGVCRHLEEIDSKLESTSENWALDRMPVVDRAILRLAVYEMLYVDEVPVSVAINEAVELAKAYGGEDESSRFVNGVLGRIARAAEVELSEGQETVEQELAVEPEPAAEQEIATEQASVADSQHVDGQELGVELEPAAEQDVAAEQDLAEEAESPSALAVESGEEPGEAAAAEDEGDE